MDDGRFFRPPCRSRGRCRNVTILIILIVHIIHTSVSLDTQIAEMRQEGLEKHDISIFVEERVEYIHSRIDLKPLIVGVEQFTKLRFIFDMRVNTTLGKILSNRVRSLNDRLERKLHRMYPNRLRKIHREKRALEFVGNLIAKLFGNPGPEDWKQNKRNVLAMKEAIERQMTNSIIQHHDIDQNRHAINLQNEMLKEASKTVMSNENRLNVVSSAVAEFESFLELENMFDSISEIVETLHDIKHDAKTGRCNMKGLNYEFLIEHLRAFESNKNGIAPVFASWEWHSYYYQEMCEIALNEDSLWVTMRIPIINLAEQMTRAVPSANQLWIKPTFNGLGFEVSLFKVKLSDTFMMASVSNLETCSILGSTRVCNMRKTKFREANPYVVPLDIGHDRVILISNSSFSNYSMTSLCGNKQNVFNSNNHVMLRTPDECAVVSRSFEISKVVKHENIETKSKIGTVESAVLHEYIAKKNMHLVTGISNIKSRDRDSEFVLNNNETERQLAKIKYESGWSNEKIFLTSTGSLSSIIIIAIGVLILVKCMKCRNGRRERIVIKDKNREICDEIESTPKMNENVECDCSRNLRHNEQENDNLIVDQGIPVSDISKTDKTFVNHRPMCQFKR